MRGEDQREDQYDELRREVGLARLLSRPVQVTWLMLGANVILFAAAWFYGEVVLLREFGLPAGVLNVGQLSFFTGMKVTSLVEQGQWWRLLSSAFVHMDIMHMLFNGYGLYVLGPLIEKFYGRARWLIIYVGSALISGLASYLLTDAVSGGASGAIYGLVGASLVFGYKYRAELPERVSRALTSGMLPWVVFGIGVGFFDFLPMDNAAHIGGLLSGGLIALLMRGAVDRGQASGAGELLVRLIAGASLASLLVAGAFWADEFQRCTTSRDAYLQCYPELEGKLAVPERDAQ